MSSTSSSGPLSTAEIEEALGLRIPVQTAKRNEPRSSDAVRKDIRSFREKMGRAGKKIPCTLRTDDGAEIDADKLHKIAARKGIKAYTKWGKNLCRKLEKKMGVSPEKAEKLAKRAFAESATKKVMRDYNIVPLDDKGSWESWSESYCSNPVEEKHYKRRDVQDTARYLRNKHPEEWAKVKKGTSESRGKLCSAITKVLLDLDIVQDRSEAEKVAQELAGPVVASSAASSARPESPTPAEARKEVVEAAKDLAVAGDKQQEAVEKAAAGDEAGAKEAAAKADEAIQEAERASERAKEKGASDARVEQVEAAVEKKKADQRSLAGGLAAGAGAAAGLLAAGAGWLTGRETRAQKATREAAEAAAPAAPVEDAEEEDVFVEASEEPEASVSDSDSVRTDELMAALAYIEMNGNKYSKAECEKKGSKPLQKDLLQRAKALGFDGKIATKAALCEFIHNATTAERASQGEPSVAEEAADAGVVAPAGAAVVAAASESAGRKEYEDALEYLQRFPYVKKDAAAKAGRQFGTTKVFDAKKCANPPPGFKVSELAKLLGVDVSGKSSSQACSSSFSELDLLAEKLGDKNALEKYRA